MGDYWSRWVCLSGTFKRWELGSHLKIGGCRGACRNLDRIPIERLRLESLWPGKAGSNTGSPCFAQCDSQHSLLPFQLLPASCLSLVCVYLWGWVCMDIWPPVSKLYVDITVGDDPQDPGPGQRNCPTVIMLHWRVILLSRFKGIVHQKMIILSLFTHCHVISLLVFRDKRTTLTFGHFSKYLLLVPGPKRLMRISQLWQNFIDFCMSYPFKWKFHIPVWIFTFY